MATPLVGLTLVATTLIVIGLLGWATVYYVPAILAPAGHGDDGAVDEHAG